MKKGRPKKNNKPVKSVEQVEPTESVEELKLRISQLEKEIKDSSNQTNAGVVVDSKKGVAIFNKVAAEIGDEHVKTPPKAKDTSGYIARPKK